MPLYYLSSILYLILSERLSLTHPCIQTFTKFSYTMHCAEKTYQAILVSQATMTLSISDSQTL